ncbi:N-acetylmuramoyl-L-alanine amidase [Xanthobacter sp. KR7-225]|uniref:N-acetylmuramoyl-L-alanine amidase n=1 Tax=Xanthobacter sp. KR7-225 TaxID=3156613 RepID=UPI0032B43959
MVLGAAGGARAEPPPPLVMAAGADRAARPVEAAARDARLAGDGQRTRLVVDLDHAVPFRAFTLGNPYRVILDLSGVSFRFSPGPDRMRRGLVSAWRFGALAPGKARMVLEATGPVAIDRAFVLDAVDGEPARMVVDLVPTDPASFAQASAAARPPAPPPAASPAAPPSADSGDTRPVIVLDPGHGGIDTGTTGRSAFAEKTIVLETALALRDKLEKTGLYRVVMTRTEDVFIPLGERVRIARANRAALFVSLHADALAAGDGQARGASVYTASDTASDADAASLAEKENKADLIAGVDLSDESDEVAGILVDLARRETHNFSAVFARALVARFKGAVRTHRTPLRAAGFKVLGAHDVPSVLVELGYMSTPADLKLLTSDAWRERVTDAIMQAIDAFFAPQLAGTAQRTAGPVP